MAQPGHRPDLHRARAPRQRPARRARAQRVGTQAQAQGQGREPSGDRPRAGRRPRGDQRGGQRVGRRGAAGGPRPVGGLRPARRVGEDRRQRRVADRPTRRGARAGRRVRLGQDPDRVLGPGPAASRRPGPDRRHRVRGHRPRGRLRQADDQAARQQDRLHPAGADVEPRPGLHHREPADRADPDLPGSRQGRGQGTGARPARPGGHPRPEAHVRGVPAPDLGRHGATRADRRRGLLRPRPAHRRRADHGPRRDGPGRGARPAARSPDGVPHGRAAGHPQLRRGGRPVRPGLGDAGRTDRRDRTCALDLRRPAPRVHPVVVRRDPRGQQATQGPRRERPPTASQDEEVLP